ncbi:MAG TPA: ADP-forming succinate--CoA ligase subunit beta [Gammaproteobacteria bacterium]|nr:ADP-forming succinate--CoA ligase subunit beta [Gammaproteobacteria bacterium]
MNLHEYQAKQLLAKYGIPVPFGKVAKTAEEAVKIANEMKKLNNTSRFVVKAQVHAGGRGKAGGVKIVSTEEEVATAAKNMLGTRLVTYQTDANGQPVNEVLIEEPSNIARELYLGAVIDRAKQRIVFMASTEGGVDIEKIAHETPEKILTETVDPLVGIQPFQARELAFALGLSGNQIKQFTQILLALSKMFEDCDFSLLEINPLVVTNEGNLLCLDGKINIDDNALYRQPAIRDMRDTAQEDERENRARDWELNYIALDGNIGCMVNGAGLAMATMDLVKLSGGNPANFLDVGGGATKERVTEAFKIILSDQNVKAILVNIFGGIVRCDLIADGIIGAVSEVGTHLPVVVRLEGNNAELGAKKLGQSGLNIIAAESFTDAAKKVVQAATA